MAFDPTVAAIACLGVAAIGVILHLAGVLALSRMGRRHVRRADVYPAVSALRPLKGREDELENNVHAL